MPHLPRCVHSRADNGGANEPGHLNFPQHTLRPPKPFSPSPATFPVIFGHWKLPGDFFSDRLTDAFAQRMQFILLPSVHFMLAMHPYMPRSCLNFAFLPPFLPPVHSSVRPSSCGAHADQWVNGWMEVSTHLYSTARNDAGVMKRTRTVMECLHRFCAECIDKAMRVG